MDPSFLRGCFLDERLNNYSTFMETVSEVVGVTNTNALSQRFFHVNQFLMLVNFLLLINTLRVYDRFLRIVQ